MKRIIVILFYSLMISLTISGQDNNAEKLLRDAIYQEEVNGDLNNVIKLYETIVTKFPDNRAVAAKAQLHIGICYEKLGLKEARKAYDKVVNNYPDQKNMVTVAKERLALLMTLAEKDLEIPLEPKFTKIKIPTKLYESIKLSPDGKDLVLASGSDKKLWKMPLSGNLGQDFPGTSVQVNTEGIEIDHQTGLSWSGDGKWIAFSEIPLKDNQGNQGIYIVPYEGGKPKKVVENFRSERLVNYRISLSPDGKELAYSSVENGKQHIYSIPVDGSVPKQLVDIQAREPVFSPDGKMIAYVQDKNLGSREGVLGLWVISAKGGTPHLVADAGMASSPVWSPDEKMIAYLDYSREKEINIVPVSKDGEAAGKVTTIDVPEGIERVRLLAGWTPDNKIGALLQTKLEFALYTLPAKGGQATMVLHDCKAFQPRWSKDGKQIFYTTSPTDGKNRGDRLALVSVSTEGGSGKLLFRGMEKNNLKLLGYQGGNRVSPDGKMIISAAWSANDTTLLKGGTPKTRIWKIPVDGSEPTQVTKEQEPFADLCPSWSPDGKTIAFIRYILKEDLKPRNEMYMVKSTGGNPELLFGETDKFIMSPVWSPDGKMIAYLTKEKELPQNNLLNIFDINNGISRVVGEVPMVFVNIELVWSPDSKRIAFNEMDGRGGKVIKIMSLSDGSIEDIKTNLVDVNIYHLDWSPDGERFVFGGWKGGEAEFWFMENFLPLDKLAQEKDVNINPSQLTNKKIWNELDTDLEGAPSPDGKFISYVDWETGDLAIYEIATEKKRRLTNKGSWDESNEYALMSRWSPDGKQIVYDWKNGNDFCDLRIIGLDGSEPRILSSNKEVKWTYTYDWSPDGKQILAYFDRKNGTDWIGQMVLVSTTDGSVRVLKTTPITETGATGPENMCFSPDGRSIVYDFPQKEGSLERDIFMMSIDGIREVSLVEHPAHDELFGWTPDGKNILFASDRNGTFSLWSKQIVEGKPQGSAKLVKSNMGAIEPLGFTREGSYYYGYSQKNNNMYNAELDSKSGEILSQPKKIITRFEGYNQAPSYSPDGKYLAYISRRFPLTIFPDYTMAKVGGNVLCIRYLETGEEREIIPGLNRFRSPRWSSDGRSVFVIDMNNSGSKQIDIQTGNVTSVLFDDNLGPQPTERSHDGKTIFYVHRDRKAKVYQILVRNLESGTQKEIFRSDGGLHIRLSPDGQWLAIQENYLGMSNKVPTLNIIPSAGGEPEELCRFEEGIEIRYGAPFTWTPDGEYILYALKSPKKEIKKWDLYRIPAKSGEPEKLEMEMSGFLMNLSIHPDGRHIAFSITEQSNAEIWVMENFLPKEETVNK